MNITRATRRGGLAAVSIFAATALLTACSSGGAAPTAGDGTGEINVWSHQSADGEVAAVQAAVDGFNASQSDVKVKLRLIPEDSYTTTINNTPQDQLPDVLDMDGPTVASLAYNGKLGTLADFVSQETIDNATDGSIAQGTYDGDLYALAQFDSAMGFFGNKALLDAAGVEYPASAAEAWTADEFAAAVETLAAASPSGKSLDITESALAGEWGTYGFAPLVWSAGGNLIEDGKAEGVLDSTESVQALTDFATWKPFVDANADGKAFPEARVAIGMGGHWLYPSYSEAIGSDLLVLPLPDMGNGAKAGAGSWTWGIGATTKNGKAAGEFLDYLLNDTNVNAMTAANGAPPATQSAFADAALYQEGGALALWGDQLANACASDAVTDSCVAVYRPVTPGYPTITSKFSGALAAIWGGAAPQSELSDAAKAIDSNFADNSGYK